VYEVPLDPVTLTEAALDAVTVSLSDFPAEMLPELAVMVTVGMDAAALLANTENTENTRNKCRNFCMAGRL
jgi:hypothetical protein